GAIAGGPRRALEPLRGAPVGVRGGRPARRDRPRLHRHTPARRPGLPTHRPARLAGHDQLAAPQPRLRPAAVAAVHPLPRLVAARRYGYVALYVSASGERDRTALPSHARTID